MNANHLGLSNERNLLHKQTIAHKRAFFEVELSYQKMKFFILVRRQLKFKSDVTKLTKQNMFLKVIWVT